MLSDAHVQTRMHDPPLLLVVAVSTGDYQLTFNEFFITNLTTFIVLETAVTNARLP